MNEKYFIEEIMAWLATIDYRAIEEPIDILELIHCGEFEEFVEQLRNDLEEENVK